MRNEAIRTLVLALLLCGVAVGQQPGVPSKRRNDVGDRREKDGKPKQKAPEKTKLEEMLAEALKNNPDIRVAVAKLAEADAELNRTRLQVIQKVVTVHHAIETQKKTIAHQEARCKELRRLIQNGAVSPTDYAEATQALTLAKGKLEELEAQQPALLGEPPSVEYSQFLGQAKLLREAAFRSSLPSGHPLPVDALWEKTHKATGPMAEKIRKALGRPISVSFTNHPVKEVADLLSKQTGLVIQFVGDPAYNPEEQVAIRCDELSLSAVLQLLEDSLPRHTILVRDYGLLIAPKKNVPPGAISVQEFLRPKPAYGPGATNNTDPSSPLPWKVPDNIEGTVKKIDPQGRITISLNSVDGLLDGHTLHLYRSAGEQPKEKYLGAIRIFIGVFRLQGQGANEAMGSPVGRLSEPPKVGDKVSARMPSGGRNSPPASVEGLIKSVDKDGLLTISIGSDAGLAKGHTLELFRLNASSPKESKYLGTIRIFEAQAKESIAQAVGRLTDTPKAGDRVASRILGK